MDLDLLGGRLLFLGGRLFLCHYFDHLPAPQRMIRKKMPTAMRAEDFGQ